jgi:mono/diheme cytochrome c family protein
MKRFGPMLVMCATIAAADGALAQPTLEQRGRALVVEMCGACHAVDRTGRSPHAAAPEFRRLDRRLDLDGFVQQLRDGLISSHQDMPNFRFTREDARAVVAYLRTIQAP